MNLFVKTDDFKAMNLGFALDEGMHDSVFTLSHANADNINYWILTEFNSILIKLSLDLQTFNFAEVWEKNSKIVIYFKIIL